MSGQQVEQIFLIFLSHLNNNLSVASVSVKTVIESIFTFMIDKVCGVSWVSENCLSVGFLKCSFLFFKFFHIISKVYRTYTVFRFILDFGISRQTVIFVYVTFSACCIISLYYSAYVTH